MSFPFSLFLIKDTNEQLKGSLYILTDWSDWALNNHNTKSQSPPLFLLHKTKQQ